jgi:hypothetical protein
MGAWSHREGPAFALDWIVLDWIVLDWIWIGLDWIWIGFGLDLDWIGFGLDWIVVSSFGVLRTRDDSNRLTGTISSELGATAHERR